MLNRSSTYTTHVYDTQLSYQYRDASAEVLRAQARGHCRTPNQCSLFEKGPLNPSPPQSRGVGIFYLRLGIFTCGWSLLLAVVWLGSFYTRLKFSWIFLAYRGNTVWSSVHTAPPGLEIGFALFLLTVPPTVSRDDEP